MAQSRPNNSDSTGCNDLTTLELSSQLRGFCVVRPFPPRYAGSALPFHRRSVNVLVASDSWFFRAAFRPHVLLSADILT